METDATKAVADADLVIEAIVENLETKQQLFASLDKTAPRFDNLLASSSASTYRFWRRLSVHLSVRTKSRKLLIRN